MFVYIAIFRYLHFGAHTSAQAVKIEASFVFCLFMCIFAGNTELAFYAAIPQ